MQKGAFITDLESQTYLHPRLLAQFRLQKVYQQLQLRQLTQLLFLFSPSC